MPIPWEEHVLNVIVAELKASLPEMLATFECPEIVASAICPETYAVQAVDTVAISMAGGDDGPATQYSRDAEFTYEVEIKRFNPNRQLAERHAARTRAAIQQVLWNNRALDNLVKRITWTPWMMVPGRHGENGPLGVQLIWGIGAQKKVAVSSFSAP